MTESLFLRDRAKPDSIDGSSLRTPPRPISRSLALEELYHAAFALLARGEKVSDVPADCEVRSEQILLLADPDFCRIYIGELKRKERRSVDDSQLHPGAPEFLQEALAERRRIKELREKFPDEVAGSLKGDPIPPIEAERFIRLAAKGVSLVGEAARIHGAPLLRVLMDVTDGSPEFVQTRQAMRQPVDSIVVPPDFNFDPPRVGTRDREEQIALLRLAGLQGIEKLAESGKSDLLRFYIRSCRALAEGDHVSAAELNFEPVLEGLVQILALVDAVYTQTCGAIGRVAPFSRLMEVRGALRQEAGGISAVFAPVAAA